MAFRDRIKKLARVKASELVPHPMNWRQHGDDQRAALDGALGSLGFAGAIIARELDDGRLQILDGHCRAEQAGDQKVPVLVTDLNDDEARLLLATYDPIGDLATTSQALLDELVASLGPQEEALAAILADLASAPAPVIDAPEGFEEVSPETIETNCQCPKCGYRWSA